MATFDVYPQPQVQLLPVATGATVTTPFLQERRSGDAQPVMHIRVATNGAANLVFKLQAGTGDPETVPSTTGIFDQPAKAGNYVADSFLTGPSNGVFSILVQLYLPGPSNWKLIVINNGGAQANIMFVVSSADGGVDGGARQPWIVADSAVTFSEVLITDTDTLAFTVSNRGTGDLTSVNGALSGTDAASFTVTPPPLPVGPASSANGSVTLLPVGTTKTLAASLKLQTNDTTSQASAGHNDTIAIAGTVDQLEVAFMLDASGSMALGPDGNATTITIDPNATRYGLMKAAVETALTTLVSHAPGKGFFGVGMYPNITALPADPNAAYGGPLPVVSPSAADFQGRMAISDTNVSNASAAVEQHFTRVNSAATPMGAGIQHAIGDSAGGLPWGYFLNDDVSKNMNRRWLFLMSDGNQNSGQDPSAFYMGAGSFVNKKIQVGTIGYGNDGAPVEPVNKMLLSTIAQNGYLSNGTNFHFTLSAGSQDDIKTFMKPLLFSALKLESTTDPSGVLTSTNPMVTRQVSITSYDEQLSFFASWMTFNPDRLRVQVRTPLGELIETPGVGYRVDTNPRFRMLTFSREFLSNSKDPANPRFGVWTLILTLNPPVIIEVAEKAAAAVDSENYGYDVFLRSRLKLRPELNQSSYAPGDKIQISARLTLDGKGIPNSSVTLSRLIPGAAAANFLARSPITAQEYNAAAEAQHTNPDIDSTGIKLLGLAKKGVKFDLPLNTDLINMVDADNTGVYVGSTATTSVPGTYQFMITAVGALPDGTFFRRERPLDIQVTVQPGPEFTLFHVDYSVITQGNQKLTQAVMMARPQDGFGNAVFIDPNVDPTIVFTTTAGTFTGPIVDNHDGSYSQTLVYAPTENPVVGVTSGGTIVVPKSPVASLPALHYIDRVFQFKSGREAVPGANKHKDPHACLNDFTAKPAPPEFVALGGGGSIVVGFKDHSIEGTGGNDVTIFVKADGLPRPYLVEATEDDDCDDWCEIGRSAGVTQSFGLHHKSKTINARAIRITDLSWRLRNPDGTILDAPGTCLVAVGAPKICEAHTDILQEIENIFKKIF